MLIMSLALRWGHIYLHSPQLSVDLSNRLKKIVDEDERSTDSWPQLHRDPGKSAQSGAGKGR